MWSIRLLNGPLAGQTFRLKEGENLIGRSPECPIMLNVAGISKKHARIMVSGQNVSIVDLQSSNGTFVNGVRVQSRILNPAQDKLSVFNILFDLQPLQEIAAPPEWQSTPSSGNTALQSQPVAAPRATAAPAAQRYTEAAQNYVETVAMPGVYHLIELFEFRQVLAGLLAGFILLVTLLSVFPMMRLTKASIEKESRRRALTIARNLAVSNLNALQQGIESAVSTRMAEREDGVQVALIVSERNGQIIAPVSKAGAYADEPFIHKARRFNKEVVEQIDDDLIGASVPIRSFNGEVGAEAVTAYAMVLYNMGSLAVDDNRAISLFSQTLLIALLIGGALFFILYKLTSHPLVDLNQQLDAALRDERGSVETRFQIPELKKLIFNINTALNRVSFGSKEAPKNNEQTRKTEFSNLVQLMSNPAMLVDKDRIISFVNQGFEDLVGMRLLTIQEQSLEVLSDQALKLSIADLLDRCISQPGMIVSNQLDINGQNFDVDAQAIQGPAQIEFFVVSIKRKADEIL